MFIGDKAEGEEEESEDEKYGDDEEESEEEEDVGEKTTNRDVETNGKLKNQMILKLKRRLKLLMMKNLPLKLPNLLLLKQQVWQKQQMLK